MSRYSGLGYPFMFSKGASNVVTDIDKLRADILFLLNLQVRNLLMRPEVGIDAESLLFANDVAVTRDFMFNFVNNSVIYNLPDVELVDVFVDANEGIVKIHLSFIYKVGNVEFSVDYLTGGVE